MAPRLQNSSARPAGGYGVGGGYDDLPLGHGTGGAAYGHDGIDCFGGAVRRLGMGMSNGVVRPVIRSVLEDSSSTTRAHSSPLRPMSFAEILL